MGFNVLALLGLEPDFPNITRKVARMKGKIALITILTDDVPQLVAFYRDVLGFEAENPRDDMTEFVSEGVRFAVCNRTELVDATHHPSFSEPSRGQAFELAFPLPTRAWIQIGAGSRPGR